MQVVRTLACDVVIGRMAAIGVMAALAFGAAGARAAEPQVVVDVASGRQFRGTLDSTSTADQLVLRTEQAGVTLRRSIRWGRVVRATEDGMPVEIAELRGRVQGSGFKVQQELGDGERGARNRTALPRKIEMRGEPPAVFDEPVEEEAPLPRVAMLSFDAAIVNWDSDVETDGVLINIVPLDIYGSLAPVNGTVEVELFAPQRRILEQAPQSGGDTLELVERWTRAITPADFGPSGARLRLPFGAITPELQPNWTASYYGLVHVRLAVPGQGVFDDSRDGVRIKPFAPNRDRLEMKTGQRFLSTENLGRRE